MNRVVERRLALWPDTQTRAEAARLFYVEGWELGKVLALYPNEVITSDRGVSRGAARRAIWAHYAVIQEAVGEPDVDPDDRAAVERLIREEGVEVARCRTGSSLDKYKDDFRELDRRPDTDWYERQAPPSWPVDVDAEGRGQREQAAIRGAMCPECFCIHAGECR